MKRNRGKIKARRKKGKKKRLREGRRSETKRKIAKGLIKGERAEICGV